MSLERAKRLREERLTLWNQANEIIERAQSEDRDLTDEEHTQINTIHDDVEKKRREAEQLERHHDMQRQLDDPQPTRAGGRQSEGDPNPAGDGGDTPGDRLRAWLANEDGLQPRQIHMQDLLMRGDVLTRRLPSLRDHIRFQTRAQGVDTDTAGGHTVAEDFRNVLETAMLQFGGMRQARTSILRTATGADLPMPTADDTSNKGELLGESESANEQDVTFGRVVLGAFKYSSKFIHVSIELLQDSAFDLPGWLAARLGERIGRITNQHFTTGDGSGKPNGVVTAAPEGFTGANTAAIHVDADEDDLLETMHSVDPAYRGNAEWMFNDGTLKAIKKLKDGDNRSLWSAGLAVREPDTIHDKPYVINQDMPNLGAGNKPILFGDFSRYFIRDVMDIRLMRLDEIAAKDGEVVFIAFSRHDADLLDAGTGPIKSFNNSDS